MREWPPNGELSGWIAKHFPPGFQGYAVDVGASDGISVSTTYILEKARWTVLCVEPNPIFHKRLKELRAFVDTCAVADQPQESALFHSYEPNPEAYSALKPFKEKGEPNALWGTFKVSVRTLDQCLEQAQFPRLDALCVDVEGGELEVLKGCDLARWDPKVIVAESWDENGPMDDYLREKGYSLVGRNVHNSLFRRSKDNDVQARRESHGRPHTHSID